MIYRATQLGKVLAELYMRRDEVFQLRTMLAELRKREDEMYDQMHANLQALRDADREIQQMRDERDVHLVGGTCDEVLPNVAWAQRNRLH